MSYYYIYAADVYESDFIYLENSSLSDELKRGCSNSEFQYIPQNICTMEISGESGDELPDFICDEMNSVPLISERLKKLFDENNIRNLYYQRVNLMRKRDNLSVSYWLAVPPRINCLDYNYTEIDELWNKAENIVIDPDKVGNYNIFKIANVSNKEIIVTEKLKNLIEEKNYTIGFLFVNDETLN